MTRTSGCRLDRETFVRAAGKKGRNMLFCPFQARVPGVPLELALPMTLEQRG